MASIKYALITGATGAIGKSVARLIAGVDQYHVTITGRDETRTIRAKEDLIRTSGNYNIDHVLCDLSRRSEIEALAAKWSKPLHLLVNNAAVTPRRREETPEGIEMQWATNVLGYFWMMKYFTPILEKHAPARIVNVASYWAGDLDIRDPEFKRRHYNNDIAYRQSKQADRMLTVAFARRLAEKNITVNACHPGDVRSDLATNLGYGGHESPDQGAATPVWLATSTEVEGISGKYFEHKAESICRFSQEPDLNDDLYELCNDY
ncbi:MAG TPA: SDR family NAD(P)-dependent oxidoreductase [Bacteroidales bacterium]|nr:SDR family NAD(P)-dependent oxidoreductase [Bacteroidales bacterium]